MSILRIESLAPALVIALLLAGCTAPLGCISGAGWEAAGRADALAGLPQSQFERRARACGAAGADRAAWLRGHAAGLERYCTEATARSIGYRRHELYNARLCPKKERRRLQDAYHRGYGLREMQDDLRKRRSRLLARPVVPRF